MTENEELKTLLHEVEPDIIAFRRWFHENPELSRQERETGRKIAEILKEQDIPYEIVGDYGILATIKGGNDGKTVLLRADMDALPVTEAEMNLKQKKVCISNYPEVSHACGHDGHMAMMLGAMLILNRMKEKLPGTVLLAFEQAEELGGGIDAMLEALQSRQVDTCFGLHLYAGVESGKLSVQPGERMAALTAFTIRVKGKGGHASRPDLTVNPLMCMAHMLVSVNSIWTGEVNPTKTVTLGIGAMKCGEKGNVIADEGTFSGTMRYFDTEEGEKAFASLQRVCEHVAEAHRCTIAYDKILQMRCAVVNDEVCSRRAERGIRALFGEDAIAVCEPWFATESMSMYLQKYPGVFAFLGICDVEKGYGAGHHTKEFDYDEAVLVRGTAAAVKYTIDSLNELR